MWSTLRVFKAAANDPRPPEEESSTPVSRTQRMQRLRTQGKGAPIDNTKKLKEFAKSLDQWSEARTNKSVLESWMSITPRVRIVMGLAAVGFSLAGLYVADWLEDKYPDRKRQATSGAGTSAGTPSLQSSSTSHDEHAPRFFSISVVDRK